MKSAIVDMILGKNLEKQDLNTINIHRKKEFQSREPIKTSENITERDKPYFLVKNIDKKFVAYLPIHTSS